MDNQYQFYKLTPSDDVEMGIYEKAMEYVFSNKDIRNIAISGAYGAGKSSMLESYKKEHQDKKFIHISLAHFTSTTGKNAEENKEDDGKEKREIALEGKIINQLIHQIDPQKVPLTNFRIKKDMDKRHILKVSLLITTFIAITCFLRFKSTWENMINGFSIDILRKVLGFTTTKEAEFMLGIVALIILGIAIYEGIKLQKSVKVFKKLTFQGNQIEIFEETKDSYFDKYLNEVLYIFKHADVDGIIFEDIDRYNTNVIFEKLREINFLLNSKERAEDEEKSAQVIRFFYLLRDDIFESKDRTKFFDFILPIVPIVDASNAYDKFIDYFKQANLLELFDMELVQRLSLYVDDMRVLKNICNEFIIYHERLKTSFTEQGNSKLLAMIVYKNLFPKDFSSLQVGRGYVYTLFTEKESFIQNIIEQLKQEIESLQTDIQQIKDESCNDLDELNALYFLIDGEIIVDGKKETDYLTRKEFVKAILSSKNVKRYSYGYGQQQISIENEQKAMEKNPEYVKRKNLMEKRDEGQIGKNYSRTDQLKKQIGELEHVYLKDVITRENETTIFKTNYKNVLDEIEEFAEVKRSPYFDLIKMLIREGYLDETYPDYMTYFYENSITANDKTFVRSVTDRRKKPFDYPLDNAAVVVSRMRVLDFKEQEALNYELLEQLLSDTEKYKEQLKNFLENISNIEPVEFVSQFLERDRSRKNFVREFNTYWSGATEWILSEEGFSMPQKRRYVADTFCVSSSKVIFNHNGEKEISEFIEGDPEFLSIQNVDKTKLKIGLKLLKIEFININIETADSELLRFVYENNMYQINMEMIQKVIKLYYADEEEEDVLGKNLSIILSREEEPLCKYIKKNIDLYMSALLSETQETDDTEEVVLYVLNSSEILEENMRLYIVSMKKLIPHLKMVNSAQWWGELLMQDKVQNNIENLCDYYFLSENGLDENLIHYINGFDSCPNLESGNLDNKYGEGSGQKFFQDIIKENAIANDKYEGIVCAFGLKCTILPQNEIASDKMEILVDRDVLEMNADTLAVMREHYPEKCMSFILKNIEKYVALMNRDRTMFLSSEMLQLLEEEIGDELKIQLLGFETKPISIQNKKYSARVEDYIVEYLYNYEDFQYLLQWYPSNRVQLQKLIREMAIRAISNREEILFAVHTKLFEQLMQNDQLYDEDKQSLLINQIKMGATKGAVKFAFEQLGLIEYKEILEGRSGKFPVSKISVQILRALQERKWIADFKTDTDDPKFFCVYGKAARKKKEEVPVGA